MNEKIVYIKSLPKIVNGITIAYPVLNKVTVNYIGGKPYKFSVKKNNALSKYIKKNFYNINYKDKVDIEFTKVEEGKILVTDFISDHTINMKYLERLNFAHQELQEMDVMNKDDFKNTKIFTYQGLRICFRRLDINLPQKSSIYRPKEVVIYALMGYATYEFTRYVKSSDWSSNWTTPDEGLSKETLAFLTQNNNSLLEARQELDKNYGLLKCRCNVALLGVKRLNNSLKFSTMSKNVFKKIENMLDSFNLEDDSDDYEIEISKNSKLLKIKMFNTEENLTTIEIPTSMRILNSEKIIKMKQDKTSKLIEFVKYED